MTKIARPAGIPERHILFTIEKSGNVITEPRGFSDGSCTAATREYEEVLGVVVERKNTGPDCPSVNAPVQQHTSN